MENFLGDRIRGNKVVMGLEDANKPVECYFKNYDIALELLHKHLTKSNKAIVVHTDVDMDGIGSAYILDRFIQETGQMNRLGYMINSEKVHGIAKKHIDYVNSSNVGLLIILDSSTNEIELIKQLKCDVLVIDHHEVLHKSLEGETRGGKYIILNNMVNNTEQGYIVNKDMSCGLVLYEFLSLYEKRYRDINILESSLLYQWATVTLYTDAIKLANERNQYYIDRTFNTLNLEPTLRILLDELSKFDKSLNKTFINFTLAPRINKAIRAGATKDVLNIVLRHPDEINTLKEYDEKQNEIIRYVLESLKDNKLDIISTDTYNILDITNTNIHRNYCGVIASKIIDKTNKATAVCIRGENGLMEGSFRGVYREIDYRLEFEINNRIYAQGHSLAFGFKATKEELIEILDRISLKIPKKQEKWYLTAGDIEDSLRGIHHIDNMDKFKKDGKLLGLAIANSKLSTDEAIDIHILNNNNIEIDWRDKYGICNILGLDCKVFEMPTTKWLSIYIEYRDTIEIYLRNVYKI